MKNKKKKKKQTYNLQTFLSQLYFFANAIKLGSIMPPLRRKTKWRVDSKCNSNNNNNNIEDKNNENKNKNTNVNSSVDG